MPSPRRGPAKKTKSRPDITATNPNHHLWQHGKNWWVYCAINPTPRTKDKLRRSLSTECLKTARFRRDELFRRLQAEGMLGRIRALPQEKAPARSSALPLSSLTWQQRVDAILGVVLSLSGENFPVTVVGAGQGKMQVCCS
ncbi:MAG: integrase [Verrucomicrobia bacterium]|nr:integrase [Verrucomicrobiota bacterium]